MIIDVKDLSLGYEEVLFENLNFTVENNDFLTIMGANGSGKSTLIKGLLGLIKPLKGEINYYIDQNTIGYMPQSTKVDQNFPASVYEIVLSGALNRLNKRVFFNKKEKALALQSLKTLGIEDLKNKSFAALSGGQRQKVLLARALTSTRELLILDEPSNNLDYESKQEFYELIHKLNNQGITIIMITHDIDMSSIIGNKVLSFEKDEIFFGDVKDYERKYHHD